jgi:hypothetical protein
MHRAVVLLSCTWVLWTLHGVGAEWSLFHIFDTRKECEVARKAYLDTYPKWIVEMRKRKGFKDLPYRKVRVRCLPDTIDPKALKR